MTKVKTSSLQKQLESAQKKRDAANNEIAKLEEKLAKETESKQPKPIWESITTLGGIYKHLKRNPKKDVIKIHALDKEDHAVIEAVIERLCVSKVYRGGKPLGRGVKRWSPWSWLNTKTGAGLVFHYSTYGDDRASLTSAARLSFPCEEASDAYFKYFQKTEEKAIGL